MPAKPATFDRSFPGLPSEFCHDDERNSNAPLPPHLNAYFMDLDEFFQATGSSNENTGRFNVSSMQQPMPTNEFSPSAQSVNNVPRPPEVRTPPASVVGVPPGQDHDSRCEFPGYQQPMQNWTGSELDAMRCNLNGINSNYGSLSAKVESDDGSMIDLDSALGGGANWNPRSNASDCSGSCRFDTLSTHCENSLGSDCPGSDDNDFGNESSSEKVPTKHLKKRGGGKPGRKRKREYIYDPKPLQHKLSQTAVPEDLKTNDYWERRKRNNLAAKRSRENRRMKEMEVLNKCSSLERENSQMKAAMRRLEMRNAWLEKAIAEYLKGMNKSAN